MAELSKFDLNTVRSNQLKSKHNGQEIHMNRLSN